MKNRHHDSAAFVADALVLAALIGAQKPKARRRLADSLLHHARRLLENAQVLHLCDGDPRAGAEARAEAARLIFERLADWPPLRDSLDRYDRQTVVAIAEAERQSAHRR